MIEEFDPSYDDFFEEPSYQKRWNRLLEIHRESYRTFRLLFVVETLAMMDRWAEPSPEVLGRLWAHKKSGGVLGIRFENLEMLFLPLWTLDAAKAEVQLYRVAVSNNFQKRYPLGTLRCYSSALIHAWWALETLMNEFASIVLEQRSGAVPIGTRALLQESRLKLDKGGNPVEEPYYQGVSERIQFIFRFLTGSPLDRESADWRHLMELKNARDGYVHRLGRPEGMGGRFGADSVVFNGMAAVRAVVARVLRETPEFEAKFVYTYLAFWCCGTESPFVWDGNEGERFFVGLAEPTPKTLADLLAPVPGNL